MSQFDTGNKDVVLAMAVANGATNEDAAHLSGLSLSTVKRRKADPDFQRFVSDIWADLLKQTLGRLTGSMTKAIDALIALLDDPSPTVRMRAVRLLMTLGIKLQDAIDLNERVRKLENDGRTPEDFS
jgi:hypothetical protein